MAINSYLNPPRTGEDKLIGAFLLLSIVGHGLFFVFDRFDFFDETRPLVQEWSIDTELIADSDFTAPEKTSLPDSKKAEEVAVPDNLLPQLPKQFAIKEPPKAEEGIADPELKPKEIKEVGKENNSEKDETVVNTPSKEDDNQVDAKDALKRLALERLRKMQKEPSREKKAPEQDALAKIAKELEKSGKINRGAITHMNGPAVRRYLAVLQTAIKKSYTLPKTFKLENPNMVAQLAIVINARGELMSVEIHSSSNDQVFDDYAIEAAKNAAPFTKPPEDLVGERILVNFTP